MASLQVSALEDALNAGDIGTEVKAEDLAYRAPDVLPVTTTDGPLVSSVEVNAKMARDCKDDWFETMANGIVVTSKVAAGSKKAFLNLSKVGDTDPVRFVTPALPVYFASLGRGEYKHDPDIGMLPDIIKNTKIKYGKADLCDAGLTIAAEKQPWDDTGECADPINHKFGEQLEKVRNECVKQMVRDKLPQISPMISRAKKIIEAQRELEYKSSFKIYSGQFAKKQIDSKTFEENKKTLIDDKNAAVVDKDVIAIILEPQHSMVESVYAMRTDKGVPQPTTGRTTKLDGSEHYKFTRPAFKGLTKEERDSLPDKVKAKADYDKWMIANRPLDEDPDVPGTLCPIIQRNWFLNESKPNWPTWVTIGDKKDNKPWLKRRLNKKDVIFLGGSLRLYATATAICLACDFQVIYFFRKGKFGGGGGGFTFGGGTGNVFEISDIPGATLPSIRFVPLDKTLEPAAAVAARMEKKKALTEEEKAKAAADKAKAKRKAEGDDVEDDMVPVVAPPKKLRIKGPAAPDEETKEPHKATPEVPTGEAQHEDGGELAKPNGKAKRKPKGKATAAEEEEEEDAPPKSSRRGAKGKGKKEAAVVEEEEE